MADDDLLIREGVQHLLESDTEIELVAVAADRDGLLAAVERAAPDIVLTDMKMPPGYGTEGIEIARRLHASHPETGVIVVSQYAGLEYALAFFETGTDRRGYLLKDRLGNREQLTSAITQVASGACVIDPKLVEALVRRGTRETSSPLRTLTAREHEVLTEVAAGRSNAAIARELVITKRAVEQHVSAIFAKLALPGEEEASRRVTATLLFLGEQGGNAAGAVD
jgi:DNA-binding NarL/FixJ family response regulator